MDQQHGSMRFSVVVPAYNEAAYLGSALESLLAQDYPDPYEIIVVDNNSTDETYAVAAAYGVRVVREPEQGVCAARQRGAALASGEFVVSTDADTVQAPDWLATIAASFAANPDAVAVASPCRYADAALWARVYPRLLFGLVWLVSHLTGHVFYMTATNVAMRRSAFPGYDLKLTQGGDELDLLRRLRHRGRVVWDPSNVVVTSARRLQRGFVYNFFATFLVYYLFAYFLNRWSRQRWFGMAPAFREGGLLRPPRRRRRRTALTIALVAVASVGLVTLAAPTAVAELTQFWRSR